MAIVKTLKDRSGNVIYPQTRIEAVYDTEGRNLSEAIDAKISTVSSPTAGNIPVLNAGGGIDDSGKSLSDLGDMLKATYDPQGKAQDIFAYADSKADAKISKVSSPTAGNIPILTADGQIADSGKNGYGNADIITASNLSVPTSAWTSDTTYEEFSYRAAITIAGCTAAYKPDVTLSLADAMSGNFAPIAESYAGGVYIYAAAVPDTSMTIPNITLLKEVE